MHTGIGFLTARIRIQSWRRGCDQNWRQFRLAVSTANESWRFNNCQLKLAVGTANKIGVLTTANFVGSWHWQLGIGS